MDGTGDQVDISDQVNVLTGAVVRSGSRFPVGLTIVRVTATDPSGNSRDCSIVITVSGECSQLTLLCPIHGTKVLVAD